MFKKAALITVLSSFLVAGACTGLDEDDYARLNYLMHQSQIRSLTEEEVAEIKKLWDERGDFDWELLVGNAFAIVAGLLGLNKYRNLKRLKRGEDV